MVYCSATKDPAGKLLIVLKSASLLLGRIGCHRYGRATLSLCRHTAVRGTSRSASAVSIGTDSACGCLDYCDRAVFEHERVDVLPSLIDGLQLTRVWRDNSVAGDGRLRADGLHELGDRMFGKMACDIGLADDSHQAVVVDDR